MGRLICQLSLIRQGLVRVEVPQYFPLCISPHTGCDSSGVEQGHGRDDESMVTRVDHDTRVVGGVVRQGLEVDGADIVPAGDTAADQRLVDLVQAAPEVGDRSSALQGGDEHADATGALRRIRRPVPLAGGDSTRYEREAHRVCALCAIGLFDWDRNTGIGAANDAVGCWTRRNNWAHTCAEAGIADVVEWATGVGVGRGGWWDKSDSEGAEAKPTEECFEAKHNDGKVKDRQV